MLFFWVNWCHNDERNGVERGKNTSERQRSWSERGYTSGSEADYVKKDFPAVLYDREIMKRDERKEEDS